MCEGRAVVAEEEEDIVEDCAQDVDVSCNIKSGWMFWTRKRCKGRARDYC